MDNVINLTGMAGKNPRKILEDSKTQKEIKRNIGRRFALFREALGKTRDHLARELDTNARDLERIETGEIFPDMLYLNHLILKYNLNAEWLLGVETGMFLEPTPGQPENHEEISLLSCHIPYNDPRYENYKEMIDLMQCPQMETSVLAEISLLKIIYKDALREWEIAKKRNKKGRPC